MELVVHPCPQDGLAILSQNFFDMTSVFCTTAVGQEQAIKRGRMNLEQDTCLCFHTLAYSISISRLKNGLGRNI